MNNLAVVWMNVMKLYIQPLETTSPEYCFWDYTNAFIFYVDFYVTTLRINWKPAKYLLHEFNTLWFKIYLQALEINWSSVVGI